MVIFYDVTFVNKENFFEEYIEMELKMFFIISEGFSNDENKT